MGPKRRKDLQKTGRASAVGWEFAGSVIGCFLLGYWLDKKFGTEPYLTLAGFALGCFAGFWSLFKAAKELSQESDEETKDKNGEHDS